MFESLEQYGMSATGLLMALLCSYVLFGRLLGMYVFDSTGSTGLRQRLMVQVVVLGDIGRSPRMRYHAASLADSGCTVDLIGYTGNEAPCLYLNVSSLSASLMTWALTYIYVTRIETNPGARINTNRHIRVRSIRQAWSVPEGFPKVFYLLWAPFKALFMTVQLFWIMACISQRPDFIIVQVHYINSK